MDLFTSRVSCICAAVFLSATAFAQSSRDELNRMTRELQGNPANNELREKVIRLGAALKPPATVPEEAERRLARGEAAFERAKDSVEYANAIREFRAAVAAAPWLAAPYFNLGVTLEKADQPNEAIASFRWYLLAAPEATDAADVKKRIFKLEYAAEQKTERAAARQAALAAQEQRVLGDWRRRPVNSRGDAALEILHVRQATDRKVTVTYDFYFGNQQTKEASWNLRDVSIADGELRFKSIWNDLEGSPVVCATYDVRGTISSDGQSLSLVYTLLPHVGNRPDTCSVEKYYKSHVNVYTR